MSWANGDREESEDEKDRYVVVTGGRREVRQTLYQLIDAGAKCASSLVVASQ